MSIILDGVLRMPPACWSGDALDVTQRHSCYIEAADRIAQLEAELRIANNDREIFARAMTRRQPELRDHACSACMPEGGDLVKVGFSCAYHHALGFLALNTSNRTGQL